MFLSIRFAVWLVYSRFVIILHFVVLLQMPCSMVAIVLVQFILWALCIILRKCPPLLFLFDFASENCEIDLFTFLCSSAVTSFRLSEKLQLSCVKSPQDITYWNCLKIERLLRTFLFGVCQTWARWSACCFVWRRCLSRQKKPIVNYCRISVFLPFTCSMSP